MSGAMIAIHAAAAAEAARAKVVDSFRLRGATAPDRARPLDEIGIAVDDPALADFIDKGIVRGVDSRGHLTVIGDDLRPPKAYYFDEATFVAARDRDRAGHSRQVRGLLIGIAILLALLAVGLVVVLTQR